MTISEAYWALKKFPHLSQATIYDLLELLTKQNYDWVVNNFTQPLLDLQKYNQVISALKEGVPVSYLTKKKRFFNADFFVDQRVLIPRVESEILIGEAIKFLEKNPQAKVLDLGCGSGVLGLTLKRLFPQTDVYLSDLSGKALEVAQINAQKQNLEVNFYQGDFLTPFINSNQKFDLIISNPPYIEPSDPDREIATKFEPEMAFLAKNDGLEFYEKIFPALPTLIRKPENFSLVMEFGWKQKSNLEKLVGAYQQKHHWQVQFQKDYSHWWRCIIISSY